jgi:hypothetical protein
VEEKTIEGGAPGVFEGGRGGGVVGEVEGSMGPDGSAWRGFSAHTTRSHAGSGTHGQSVREVRTVRPPVVDRNFSPFFKFQT